MGAAHPITKWTLVLVETAHVGNYNYKQIQANHNKLT